MTILNDPVPGHWPEEAKTLVQDLRRAYRSLEAEFSKCSEPDDDDNEYLNDDIARESRRYRFTPQQARMWRLFRSSPSRILSKRLLHLAMYRGREPESDIKIVDVNICKLRNILLSFESEWCISTFWGQGYKLDSAMVVDAAGTIGGSGMTEIRRKALLDSFSPREALTQVRFKEARCALGLSLTQMAKALDASVPCVANWTNGGTRMPPYKLRMVEAMIRVKKAGLANQPLSFKFGSAERKAVNALMAA